jgi:hypothetical protein
MEEHSAHVVQMPVECKKTSPGLVTPDFNLVIIPSGHEEGLSAMKIDPSNGAIMLLEPVNECPHAIVPELDRRRVE